MKIKTTLTTLSAIIVLAMMAVSAFSQNNAFSVVQNMGATVNSADDDPSPVISPNGLSLYFSSNRPGGQGGLDIWVSQRATLSSAWGAPQNLGATVNTNNIENSPAFSLDGRTMFLASDRPGGSGGGDIYILTRTDPNNDFGWSAPVNIGTVVNSTFNEIAPTYFEDPTTGAGTLIFSSNRVGNPMFDFHLYQSTRNANGTFNAPTPISELGTVGSTGEFGAAVRRDGLEIFFASARAGGLNPPRFDIWRSTRASVSAPWNPPTLVPGINTVAEERLPSLSPDSSILYFHSNRAGGLGDNDLYSATRCSLYAANAPCNTNRSTADFDGDGRTDISVFRPSDGTWWVLQSGTNTAVARQFGASGDKIVPADYDGDGRTDIAVFRPSDSNWYVLRSSDSAVSIVTWGLSTDKPVPGDYDGDGRTDMAVFRDGVWYILQSSNGTPTTSTWGLASDIPVAGVNAQ
jgi:Tol biopolymer transport system component